MNPIKYQIIKLTVPSPDVTVTFNTNSDKLYKKITGILVTAPYLLSFLNNSTLQLQINDKEIFPDDFEAKLLTVDPIVPSNERFYRLEEIADGSTIKGKYKDSILNFPCYPYTVYIYLKLEEKQG